MSGSDVAYAICGVADIPNRRARAFSLARLERGADGAVREAPWHIVVARWDRKLHAYVNRCPHHGGPLDWEREQFFDPAGARLMCGKHGALFELASGVCLDGPCMGQSLERVALKILDGDVCVTGVELAEQA